MPKEVTKRESGWYLVRFDEEDDFWIAKYSSESDEWLIHGLQYGMHDKDFVEIKEMVMTPVMLSITMNTNNYGKTIWIKKSHE